jgi:hypothetical protein
MRCAGGEHGLLVFGVPGFAGRLFRLVLDRHDDTGHQRVAIGIGAYFDGLEPADDGVTFDSVLHPLDFDHDVVCCIPLDGWPLCGTVWRYFCVCLKYLKSGGG